jgi:hypothetical protein
VFPSWRSITLPHVFQRFREGLLSHGAVNMHGIAGEYELLVIALRGQDLRHAFIGQDPIVHVVAHHVGVEKVPVADFHP